MAGGGPAALLGAIACLCFLAPAAAGFKRRGPSVTAKVSEQPGGHQRARSHRAAPPSPPLPFLPPSPAGGCRGGRTGGAASPGCPADYLRLMARFGLTSGSTLLLHPLGYRPRDLEDAVPGARRASGSPSHRAKSLSFPGIYLLFPPWQSLQICGHPCCPRASSGSLGSPCGGVCGAQGAVPPSCPPLALLSPESFLTSPFGAPQCLSLIHF